MTNLAEINSPHDFRDDDIAKRVDAEYDGTSQQWIITAEYGYVGWSWNPTTNVIEYYGWMTYSGGKQELLFDETVAPAVGIDEIVHRLLYAVSMVDGKA